MQDWAEIRYLYTNEGMSERAIATRLGIARDTVSRAIASAGPPKYVRDAGPSAFDEFEQRVRELLAQFPRMPAPVLADRVGWHGSSSWFRKKVAALRPDYAPKDPADRLSYQAGDQAQCDLWFPPLSTPLVAGQAGLLPVLVIVSSFSRFITAMMLPSRTTPDLLAGMWLLLTRQLEAIPRRLLWDNETGIGRRGKLAEGVAEFCGHLATRIVQLKPFDPESKGIVERANQFLETSFLPGRTFVSPTDFNTQLAVWLPTANTRHVRRIDAKPTDLIVEDRAAMLTVPPTDPCAGFSTQVRLPRDYYVRVLGNDYSVDPTMIGRMVDVRADLEVVTARCDGRLVASHPRAWTRGQTVTDSAHVTTAARLREQFQTPTPQLPDDEDMTRDLGVYDTRFGVNFDGEDVA